MNRFDSVAPARLALLAAFRHYPPQPPGCRVVSRLLLLGAECGFAV